MAAKTWYLTNASVSNGSDLSDTDPGAEAFRSPVTGWIVSTGSTNRSEWFNDVERAASTFTGTTVPDGTLDTTNGDFWTSPTVLTGNFASANWTISLCVRANTGGDTHAGKAYARIFRGANQSGASAVEVTGAATAGTGVTNLLTSATQDSTITVNPGAFSVSAEYIFIQLAWERTAAAGMTTYDVNARIGNTSGHGSRVVTSDFAATVANTLDAAAGAFAIAGNATTSNKAMNLNAAAGAFAIAGNDAALSAGKTLNAEAGSFAIVGTATTNTKDVVLNAAAGAFSIDGIAADLTAGTSGTPYALNAEPGAFAISGTAAATISDRIMVASPGAFSIAGANTTNVKALNLDAGPGAFAINGFATDLTYAPFGSAAYTLNAEPGAFAIIGDDVGMGVVINQLLSAQRLLLTNCGKFMGQ